MSFEKESTPTPKESHLPRKKIILNAVIFVVSDSLSKLGDKWTDEDKSGKIAVQILEKEGINIKFLSVLPDDLIQLRKKVQNVVNERIDIILTIGGTGIAKRDVTFEALFSILDKDLPGFGELFRAETFKEVGSVSIMSRAFAGIKNSSLLICLPGSSNAVELGLNIIKHEFQHISNLLKP